jgi:hypothetical protein
MMAMLDKKDIDILLEAGFDESDLGLVSGGRRGIELYQTPEDYFAKELIENACEAGECDLYDEIIPAEQGEAYDDSHKGIYDDQEYPGNEDLTIDVPADLREQVDWLKTINIGKMTLWEERKNNFFKEQVKRVVINIPQVEKNRMNRMPSADRKAMWKSHARDAWGELWKDAVSTLYGKHCERIVIGGKKKFNLIVLSGDDMRELGHKIPDNCAWITLMYFEKGYGMRPQVRPRRNL